jgi:hypothetical protein
MSLYDLKRIGGSASAEDAAGTKYQENFKKIIERKGCLLQQLFNLDGTGLIFEARDAGCHNAI